jgi:hypothetical protein
LRSEKQGILSMCTSILEIVECDGSGKSPEGWVKLTHAAVTFDHPHHAMLDDAVTIDFVNKALGPGARIGVELTLETAKALHAALGRVIVDVEEEIKPRPRAGKIKQAA